jgi:hypothetical protein
MIDFRELLRHTISFGKYLLCVSLFAAVSALTGQSLPIASPAAEDSVRQVNRYGVINFQELQAYRSDVFAMNLAYRGRIATGSYRGMPPGFMRYRYDGIGLDNPITGFWNEQFLPIYQIGGEASTSSMATRQFYPPTPVRRIPLTRLVFSQDYITGISYLDINFTRHWTPKNFIQLSGNNFLGDESDLGKRYQVNTYRARLHWEYEHSKWDFYYWQLRHLSNVPLRELSSSTKIKQIQHLIWLNGNLAFSAKDTLKIAAAYQTGSDRLRYNGRQFYSRDFVGKALHATLSYSRALHNATIGFEARPRWFQIRHKVRPSQRDATTFSGELFLRWQNSRWSGHLTGGGMYDSAGESNPTGSAGVALHFGKNLVGIHAFQRAVPVPLLWRTMDIDSIARFDEKTTLRYRGGSAQWKVEPSEKLTFSVEPFWLHSPAYPLLRDSLWRRSDITNYGIRSTVSVRIGRFWLDNDFSWNAKYDEAFAPQFKNNLSIRTTIKLFNNALKVDGIWDWRIYGKFHPLTFEPLFYTFTPDKQGKDAFTVSDARIQAHFRDAVVFFVWENVLSTDYEVVDNALEQFLIFRLGIDWMLFN